MRAREKEGEGAVDDPAVVGLLLGVPENADRGLEK